MKWIVLAILFFTACEKNESFSSEKAVSLNSKIVEKKTDNFSDFSKQDDDESCGTEKDLKKKLENDIAKAKKGEAFQLQGQSDDDCVVQ